jgi:hypothetical protein
MDKIHNIIKHNTTFINIIQLSSTFNNFERCRLGVDKEN